MGRGRAGSADRAEAGFQETQRGTIILCVNETRKFFKRRDGECRDVVFDGRREKVLREGRGEESFTTDKRRVLRGINRERHYRKGERSFTEHVGNKCGTEEGRKILRQQRKRFYGKEGRGCPEKHNTENGFIRKARSKGSKSVRH